MPPPPKGLYPFLPPILIADCSIHVACDKNNFVLACEVIPGNVHDSMVFDAVYEDVIASFDEVKTTAVDAGYKTPWICKKVQEAGRYISTAYKHPMSKQGFFRSYEYVVVFKLAAAQHMRELKRPPGIRWEAIILGE